MTIRFPAIDVPMRVPAVRANLHPCFVALLLLLAPIPVVAEIVMTTQAVNVRAGPDPAFPLVTWLSPRAEVSVVACTEGWHWCDVVVGRRHRGWVNSRYLSNLFFRNRIPIVTFSVAEYWNAHYQSRHWYSTLPDWIDWGTPTFVPPEPPPPRWRRTAVLTTPPARG